MDLAALSPSVTHKCLVLVGTERVAARKGLGALRMIDVPSRKKGG